MRMTLGEACHFYSGTGFPEMYQGVPDGEFPFFKVGDISANVSEGNTYLERCSSYISADVVTAIHGTIIPPDTVVFAKIGEALKKNRRAITTRESLVDNNAMGIAPRKELLRIRYFYYFMCRLQMERFAEATAVPSVRKSRLEQICLDVPSFEKQMYIENVLDAVSSVIKIRQRQLRALDTLIKARFVEMFEQGSYEEVAFGDVCEFLRNGANIKQTKGASGIPITRIETLANDVFNTDRLGYAGIFEMGKYEGYRLQAGDILISHINSIAYLGRAVQYKGQLGNTPVIHGMNLLCARIKRSFCPTFVEFFFKTPVAKEYISSITKKAVNQASITTTDLKKMRIPAPPIGEQEQFASFVSQVDKSKVAVQAALNKTQLLFNSLMQQYFG